MLVNTELRSRMAGTNSGEKEFQLPLGETQSADQPSENRVYFKALALRTRTPGARALLPATRCQSSGPLGALLSSPALDVRLITALQVLQV